jgi:hypothetical protein
MSSLRERTHAFPSRSLPKRVGPRSKRTLAQQSARLPTREWSPSSSAFLPQTYLDKWVILSDHLSRRKLRGTAGIPPAFLFVTPLKSYPCVMKQYNSPGITSLHKRVGGRASTRLRNRLNPTKQEQIPADSNCQKRRRHRKRPRKRMRMVHHIARNDRRQNPRNLIPEI